MTQLTDKIREAILGNIGTVISGRIGITDAELLVKKFTPTFDAEDMTRLPNFKSIATVMINNVPSAPFSMSLLPPMGQSNPQLRDALKKLSAAKYGKPRAEAEREIFARLGAGDAAKKAKMDQLKKAQQERMAALQGAQNQAIPGGPRPAAAAGSIPGGAPTGAPVAGGSSFLDEWLAKRQQINNTTAPAPAANANPAFGPTVPAPAAQTPNTFQPAAPVQPAQPSTPITAPNPFLDPQPRPNPFTQPQKPQAESRPTQQPQKAPEPQVPANKLHIREPGENTDNEIHIKLR